MKLNHHVQDQESPDDDHGHSGIDTEFSWVGWASVSVPPSSTLSIGSQPSTPLKRATFSPLSLMIPRPWTPPQTPSIPSSPLEAEHGNGLQTNAPCPDLLVSDVVSHLLTPPRDRSLQTESPGCLHCCHNGPTIDLPHKARSPSFPSSLDPSTIPGATPLNWVPPELLLRISSFLPANDPTPLMSLANTCRIFRSILLTDRPLVRRCLRVDLTPFGPILDDDRLNIVIRNRFQPLDAPPAMRLGWVRELDLSETRVKTLDALVACAAECQDDWKGQLVAQLPGLRFVDLSKASEFFPAQRFQLGATSRVWMAHLRSLSLAHTTGLTDAALHTLIHHLSPHLRDLNLEFCDHISDRGVACLMKAVQERHGNTPFEKLKLTGCVRLEGNFWAAANVPVRRLWVDLTSIADEALAKLIECGGGRSSRVLEWINARACGFVMDGAKIKEVGTKSGRVIVLV